MEDSLPLNKSQSFPQDNKSSSNSFITKRNSEQNIGNYKQKGKKQKKQKT